MNDYKRLPDSELEVMLIIWEQGKHVSTSDIMERLGKGKKVQLIQSYLGRLEEKGFISCEKLGRLNFYTPLVSMGEYRAKETTSFLDRLYRSSPTKLFAALLESDAVGPKELEEFKRMLDGNE